MGCHTWTYKKLSSCDDSSKQRFLYEMKKELDYYLRPFDEMLQNSKDCAEDFIQDENINPDERQSWIEWSSEDAVTERYKKMQNAFGKFADNINIDNISEFCLIIYENFDDTPVEFKVINDDVYIEFGFDTPFRVYGYPEETFTDRTELLNWLSIYDDRMGYYDKVSDDFIEGYTEGLVERINDYFLENGEDNLYFEFG